MKSILGCLAVPKFLVLKMIPKMEVDVSTNDASLIQEGYEDVAKR